MHVQKGSEMKKFTSTKSIKFNFQWLLLFLILPLLSGCEYSIEDWLAAPESVDAFTIVGIYVSNDDRSYVAGDQIPVKKGDHLFVNVRTNPPLTETKTCTNAEIYVHGVPVGLYDGNDIEGAYQLKIVAPKYNPYDKKFFQFDTSKLVFASANYLYWVCLDAFTMEWPIEEQYIPGQNSPTTMTIAAGLKSTYRGEVLNPYRMKYRTYAKAKITLVAGAAAPTAGPSLTRTLTPTLPTLGTKTPTILPAGTPPSSGNCAWVNTIVGTWVSKNNDYITFQRDGIGMSNTTSFHWTCLSNGQYRWLEGGSTYTLQFPDNNHYIMNGDTWTRTSDSSPCAWTSKLIGKWTNRDNYRDAVSADFVEFTSDGYGKSYSVGADGIRGIESQFQWTCLKDGRYQTVGVDEAYPILVDQSSIIINNRKWSKVN
jgi:hypothetical protein